MDQEIFFLVSMINVKWCERPFESILETCIVHFTSILIKLLFQIFLKALKLKTIIAIVILEVNNKKM